MNQLDNIIRMGSMSIIKLSINTIDVLFCIYVKSSMFYCYISHFLPNMVSHFSLRSL